MTILLIIIVAAIVLITATAILFPIRPLDSTDDELIERLRKADPAKRRR